MQGMGGIVVESISLRIETKTKSSLKGAREMVEAACNSSLS